MKASSVALLAAVMAVAAVASTAVAKDYTVGGSYGWDTYVDYDKWAAGKTFIVGDTITFKYEPYHNVVEVPAETDYDGCVSTNPVSVHSGGNTTFELAAAGTRYFICSIPRHCLNGTMHVKVTTVPYSASAAAAAAAADAGPSPAPLPSPPADEQQHRSNSASSPAAGPSSSAASAPRHWQQQPAMAVAGLALAALVAMAA
ncbi:blue copper protein-like [Oryza glaberrima]|uniref:Phytocyanin domain-containing protein n=2 Tax=Oryza TaxID=4527 RepID=A0A0D3GS29_9ORYZ|nr:blue copper protein-like [Oryza glaberrima]